MRNAPLHVVHVVATRNMTPDRERLILERALETATTAAAGSRIPPVHNEIRHGEIVAELIAASRGSFLMVIGGRGRRAFGRRVLGSITKALLSSAQVPVAIVHALEHKPHPRHFPVLLGLDDSQTSEGATALAFNEARKRGVDLVALHAWTENPAATTFGIDMERFERECHGVLDARLAPWQRRYPDVTVRRQVAVDHPARRLIVESREAQLVVVGSRGRGGFAGKLLGSVSSEVVRSADAPTIVVRNSVHSAVLPAGDIPQSR